MVYTSFELDHCQLIYPNRVVFNIRIYSNIERMFVLSEKYCFCQKCHLRLVTWHKILGHCNESDIKKLPNLVKRMKIKLTTNYPLNCDIFIQGKMSNDRNKTLDSKAKKILILVYSDLAGPLQPLAKDGHKYVLNFIDDYSGLTMLYFLKHKSNTLLATTKYLVDITLYGQMFTDQNQTEAVSSLFSATKWNC